MASLSAGRMSIFFSLAPGVFLGSTWGGFRLRPRDPREPLRNKTGPSLSARPLAGCIRREWEERTGCRGGANGLWERCRYSLRIGPGRKPSVLSSQDALQKAQTAPWPRRAAMPPSAVSAERISGKGLGALPSKCVQFDNHLRAPTGIFRNMNSKLYTLDANVWDGDACGARFHRLRGRNRPRRASRLHCRAISPLTHG